MSIEDVIAKVRSLKGVRIKAGILEGATYEDGKSVAQVAMWNEYGVSIPVSDRMRGYLGANGLHLKKSTKQLNIPPRPFMRNAVREDGGRWQAELAGGLRQFLTGSASLDDVTGRVGAMMQADIKKSVDSNIQPPNHPFTAIPKNARVVDRGGVPIRGGSGTKQTLIDSGTLLGSISFEVET